MSRLILFHYKYTRFYQAVIIVRDFKYLFNKKIIDKNLLMFTL